MSAEGACARGPRALYVILWVSRTWAAGMEEMYQGEAEAVEGHREGGASQIGSVGLLGSC